VWFRYIDWGVRFPTRYRLLQQMKLSDLVSAEALQESFSEWAFAESLIPEGIESGIYRDISVEFLFQLIFAHLEATVGHAIVNQLADMPLTKHITRSFEVFWSGVTS
jgi:hypothetical protein